MGTDEAIVGFPGDMLSTMIKHLKYLNKKAIPDIRSKKNLEKIQSVK